MKDLEECDEKADVEKYLLSLLDADVKDGMVASTTVIDWCKAVADWTKEVRTEEKLPYLMGLSDLCNGMCRIVESELSDKVSVGFIEKAVKALYTPTPVQNIKAKAGCWSASASHRLFIDAPESLMWLPCNGGLETAYPYSFMLQEEAREMDVKDMSDYVKYDFNLLVQLLGQVKKIELCACDFDCTDALEEHPAVTLCKPAAEQKDMRETDNRSAIFTPLRTIETGVDLYPKRKGENGKETEDDISLSASSIETLIGYPFDFVMDKKLGFKDLSSLQLSDLIPTQGTVAHYVFEKMLEDSEEGKRPMRDMLEESSFAERVDQAAREKGEILFQPEYRTLYSNYKDTIRKSIGVLLDIMDKSGLTPKKSEFKLDQDLDFSHITGSVDFYAETNSGDVVVIDFKYSKGRTYIDKLDEDKSIQLEIYSETLQKMLKKTVVAKGYYFFPINQLHTDDEHGFFKGPGVIQHKKQASSFTLEERIKNSVNRRKEELKAGKLEMEDGALLEEIDYHNSASDGSMIDLPAKDKKKKASPFANPTKYPILKDFIR